jgi:hypothetical protein
MDSIIDNSGALLAHSILMLSAAWILLKKKKIDSAEQAKSRPRRWGVRPTNMRREDFGMFDNTFQVMRKQDPDEFFRFTRMTVPLFDELCSLIKDDPRMKRAYRSRCPVSVEERLAITLW